MYECLLKSFWFIHYSFKLINSQKSLIWPSYHLPVHAPCWEDPVLSSLRVIKQSLALYFQFRHFSIEKQPTFLNLSTLGLPKRDENPQSSSKPQFDFSVLINPHVPLGYSIIISHLSLVFSPIWAWILPFCLIYVTQLDTINEQIGRFIFNLHDGI